VGKTKWKPNELTYLSFDFNKNPICCTVFQWYDGTIYGIECIKLAHSDIDSLCQVIRTRYEGALFLVTGDHSGYNRSALVKDDFNFYTAIQINLALSDNQIRVQVNPRLEENQVTVNQVFAKVPTVFDEEKCQHLIFDCMFAELRPDGKLRKDDRDDPAQQLDALDTWRYFVNTFIKPTLPVYN
jgi:hypothetical protein